ncbi:TetR/AcrR family transcriptional regulator [Streptomyces palmae]|uniref:TetR/AcrR family transcriptional regulator n=1 Tax=Streptomyces palmae TaxID=1701085 RepID=A0A4Z0GN58_9ACTN|nr:TetR/AcrR family transcriptional regulator [Streptomyces palmae]TGA97764.1 TetR/AcrR family transcriptional regulator [Streptomyces palmae]
MGRPRGFNEADVVRSAAKLFATRTYDGTSVDDLVSHLGVHRNSLYKTFGSKRGLYLAALKWSLDHEVAAVAERLAQAGGHVAETREIAADAVTGTALDLVLLAAVERAPVDAEVARLVGEAFATLDRAFGDAGRVADNGEATTVPAATTALLIGLRTRARSGTTDTDIAQVGAALAQHLGRP